MSVICITRVVWAINKMEKIYSQEENKYSKIIWNILREIVQGT
jgi:hypothetical protein